MPVIGIIPPACPGLGFETLLTSFSSSIEKQEGMSVRIIHQDDLSLLQDEGVSNIDFVWIGVTPSVLEINRVDQLRAALVGQGWLIQQLPLLVLESTLETEISMAAIEEKLGKARATILLDSAELLRLENRRETIQEGSSGSALHTSLQKLCDSTHRLMAELRQDKESSSSNDPIDWKKAEKEISTQIWAEMSQASSDQQFNGTAITHQIDHQIAQYIRRENLQTAVPIQLKQILRRNLTGLGPLQPLMEDPEINEIMVNGPHSIYVERGGRIEFLTDVYFQEKQLQVIIDRLVSSSGRRVDTSSPFCDVRWNNCRVNIVLPPLSMNGPLITIRKFKPTLLSMEDLIEEGTLTDKEGSLLRACVETRNNIIVSGNTGSGKTTLLNILSHFISDSERIITLEDAAELKLQKPHVAALETRQKNLEGEGEISMRDLLVNALRMRPDRIIVGEVRGPEAIPMIQAMNTGHDGSMTTLHANSAQDALKRLEGMILLGAPEWPLSLVREQIAAGIHLIVHLERQHQRRVLKELCRLAYQEGRLQTIPLLSLAVC